MENGPTVSAYFDGLLQALQRERAAEREAYQRILEEKSLAERCEQGYTWHPVQVEKTGFMLGDHAYVVVARTGRQGEDHRFRSGQVVALFREAKASPRRALQGVLHWVHQDRMHIVLHTDMLPDWLEHGSLGVDLMFDETSYRVMEEALREVAALPPGRQADLRDILIGRRAARDPATGPMPDLPGLNDAQREAAALLLRAPDVALVHGPPGTGKTTTVVAAVQALSRHEASILVCAPSNTAVDLLTERLAAAGSNVIRLGHVSRVDDSVLAHTLEVRLRQHPDYKHIKRVKKDAADLRRRAGRYRRRFDQRARRKRDRQYAEARELASWARQLEDRLVGLILDRAQVIACTLVGADLEVLGDRRFRTLVVDEAAQALEPATWVPLRRASRIMLIGDPCQLPPTVKSTRGEGHDLRQTLMERLLDRQVPTRLLRVQYRMHRHIMGFSNQYFYEGQLQAAPSVRDHRLEQPPNDPLVFIDTAGCGFAEKQHPETRSRYNPEEWLILCEHLYLLLEGQGPRAMPRVAIISPYREQVRHIRAAVTADARLQDLALRIDTIDGFQGQEEEVVYLSLVRSNPRAELGFLRDHRRLNVALTRARKMLVVVGDSATLGADPFYRSFLEYCEETGKYLSAWAFTRSA